MSEENVEVVRRMYAAWNAGDMDAVRDETTMRYVHHIPKHNAARQFSEFVRNQAALAAEFSTDNGDKMGTEFLPIPHGQ